MNVDQFHEHILIPTLEVLHFEIPFSENAFRLVSTTLNHESGGLQYVAQLGGGPGSGLGQCEPATWTDTFQNYLAGNPDLGNLVDELMLPGGFEGYEQIKGNLYLACAICRIHYWRKPAALPALDAEEMAAYWGKHYQTESDPVKMKKFAKAYRKLFPEGNQQ